MKAESTIRCASWECNCIMRMYTVGTGIKANQIRPTVKVKPKEKKDSYDHLH